MNKKFQPLHEIGLTWNFLILILKTLVTPLQKPQMKKAIFQQIGFIFSESIATILCAGIFVGGIIMIQMHSILDRYGATTFLGGLSVSTVIREVGPLLISFLLSGKIGAYTAAEFGNLRITHQMDALACLGQDPIEFWIAPRWIGTFLASILLLIFGLCVSILGSMLVAGFFYRMNSFEFLRSIPTFLSLGTFINSFFKSSIYAAIIATVACHQGYRAKGGAQGVGKAVSSAAFYIYFYILIANFICSVFLRWCERGFS